MDMQRLGSPSNGYSLHLLSTVLCALAVLTACTSGRPTQHDERLVCPSCERGSDSAGAETSDFSGNHPDCPPRPVSEGPSDALTANLAATQTAYDGSFENSLRWRPQPLGNLWYEEVPTPPSGYVPNTRVSVNVTLGEAEYHQRRGPDDCGVDYFRVPATFEVATADSAVASTGVGAFRVEEGRSIFDGAIDLADVRGTLDLHVEPAGGHLRLQLLVFPEGTRGSLSIDALTAARPDETAGFGNFMLGTFPDDRCSEYGFPVETDVPLSAFDGQTATEVLAGWNSRLAPVEGARRDMPHSAGASQAIACNKAEVRFDIGAPDGVCYASPSALARGWEGGFLFDSSDSRLTTADGLIDLRLGGGFAQPGVLGFARSLGLDWLPPDQFSLATGIGGVDRDGIPMLQHSFEAYFSGASTLETNGSVVVFGTCSDGNSCPLMWLRWPFEANADSTCSE